MDRFWWHQASRSRMLWSSRSFRRHAKHNQIHTSSFWRLFPLAGIISTHPPHGFHDEVRIYVALPRIICANCFKYQEYNLLRRNLGSFGRVDSVSRTHSRTGRPHRLSLLLQRFYAEICSKAQYNMLPQHRPWELPSLRLESTTLQA